ncbi:MAG: hypothetical protein Q4D38_12090 [Planctomycetia bacterium]|nr:hypothetical protein [Planctomycetia bacterium]
MKMKEKEINGRLKERKRRESGQGPSSFGIIILEIREIHGKNIKTEIVDALIHKRDYSVEFHRRTIAGYIPVESVRRVLTIEMTSWILR